MITEPDLPPHCIPEKSWGAAQSADSHLLILDYDGTLAPFRVERMEAVPYPGVRELLASIQAIGGGISLVSGRQAGEVAQLLGITPTPEIWGCHGWERMQRNGVIDRIPLKPKQEEGLIRAAFTLKNEGWATRLESKYGSLALHWRGATNKEADELHRAGKRAMTPSADSGLAVREFDGGIELRATGRDKGSAVRSILSEAPMNSFAAYLGDDQTDEDAFTEVNQANGMTLLVRPEVRPTLAQGWLIPPDNLIEFLQKWMELIQNGPNPRTT